MMVGWCRSQHVALSRQRQRSVTVTDYTCEIGYLTSRINWMPMMKWLTTILKNNKLSYIKKLPIQTRELEIM